MHQNRRQGASCSLLISGFLHIFWRVSLVLDL